jgi:hypothetical protein
MQIPPAEQSFAVAVDPPACVPLVEYGRTMNGFVTSLGRYAHVYPGSVFAVNRPGRTAVNLFTHIVNQAVNI